MMIGMIELKLGKIKFQAHLSIGFAKNLDYLVFVLIGFQCLLAVFLFGRLN
jgi:hypothetical protein